MSNVPPASDVGEPREAASDETSTSVSERRPVSPPPNATVTGALATLEDFLGAQADKRHRIGDSDSECDSDEYIDDRVQTKMHVFSGRGTAAQWTFSKKNSRPWLSVSGNFVKGERGGVDSEKVCAPTLFAPYSPQAPRSPHNPMPHVCMGVLCIFFQVGKPSLKTRAGQTERFFAYNQTQTTILSPEDLAEFVKLAR